MRPEETDVDRPAWFLDEVAHAGFAIRETDYSPSRIYAAYTCVKA